MIGRRRAGFLEKGGSVALHCWFPQMLSQSIVLVKRGGENAFFAFRPAKLSGRDNKHWRHSGKREIVPAAAAVKKKE